MWNAISPGFELVSPCPNSCVRREAETPKMYTHGEELNFRGPFFVLLSRDCYGAYSKHLIILLHLHSFFRRLIQVNSKHQIIPASVCFSTFGISQIVLFFVLRYRTHFLYFRFLCIISRHLIILVSICFWTLGLRKANIFFFFKWNHSRFQTFLYLSTLGLSYTRPTLRVVRHLVTLLPILYFLPGIENLIYFSGRPSTLWSFFLLHV